MRRISLGLACLALSTFLGAPAVLAQDDAAEDARPRRDRRAEREAVLETCATVPGATNFSVIDDRFAYLRTRGSNHYLLTTEGCDNLYESFIRRQVELVPYGRRVCQSDGSYLVYVDDGRTSTCYIQQVQQVDNRMRPIGPGPRTGSKKATKKDVPGMAV
jgi:hypothetical protein